MPASTAMGAAPESEVMPDAHTRTGATAPASEAPTPTASGPSDPYEALLRALHGFVDGTPEDQASQMFLQYMQRSGMMPETVAGQVSKKKSTNKLPVSEKNNFE